jgi:hypothetical protein
MPGTPIPRTTRWVKTATRIAGNVAAGVDPTYRAPAEKVADRVIDHFRRRHAYKSIEGVPGIGPIQVGPADSGSTVYANPHAPVQSIKSFQDLENVLHAVETKLGALDTEIKALGFHTKDADKRRLAALVTAQAQLQGNHTLLQAQHQQWMDFNNTRLVTNEGLVRGRRGIDGAEGITKTQKAEEKALKKLKRTRAFWHAVPTTGDDYHLASMQRLTEQDMLEKDQENQRTITDFTAHTTSLIADATAALRAAP